MSTNGLNLNNVQTDVQQKLQDYIQYLDGVIDGSYDFEKSEINFIKSFDLDSSNNVTLDELKVVREKLLNISNNEKIGSIVNPEGTVVSGAGISANQTEDAQIITEIVNDSTDINETKDEGPKLTGEVLDNGYASIKTSSGYEILTNTRKGGDTVMIKDPNGKLITKIWGDPHVMDNGGGASDDSRWDWHFGEDSAFILDDGTEIFVNTKALESNAAVTFARGIYVKSSDNKTVMHTGMDLSDSWDNVTKDVVTMEDYNLDKWEDLTKDLGNGRADGTFAWSKDANEGNGGWTIYDENSAKFYDVKNEAFWSKFVKEEYAEFDDQLGTEIKVSREAKIASLRGMDATRFDDFRNSENSSVAHENILLDLMSEKKPQMVISTFLRMARSGSLTDKNIESFDFYAENYENLSFSERTMFNNFLVNDKTGVFAESLVNFIENDASEVAFEGLSDIYKFNIPLDRALEGDEFNLQESLNNIAQVSRISESRVNKTNLYLVAQHNALQDTPALELINNIVSQLEDLVVDGPIEDRRTQEDAVKLLLGFAQDVAKSGDVTETMYDANYSYAKILFRSTAGKDPYLTNAVFDIVEAQQQILEENADSIDPIKLDKAREDLKAVADWQSEFKRARILDKGFSTQPVSKLLEGLTNRERALYDEFSLINADLVTEPNNEYSRKILSFIYENRDPDLIRSYSNLLSEGASENTLNNLEKVIESPQASQNNGLVNAKFVNNYVKLLNVADSLPESRDFSRTEQRLSRLGENIFKNKDAFNDPAISGYYDTMLGQIQQTLASDISDEDKAYVINEAVRALDTTTKTNGSRNTTSLDSISSSRYGYLTLQSDELDQAGSDRVNFLVFMKEAQLAGLTSMLNMEKANTTPDDTRVGQLTSDIASLETLISTLRSNV
jgi:hypothetical protein